MSRLKTSTPAALHNLGSGWQLIGMSWWYRGALCGHPLPAIAFTTGPAVQLDRYTTTPINALGLHPVARQLLLISRPVEGRRLSWPEHTLRYELVQGCLQMTRGRDLKRYKSFQHEKIINVFKRSFCLPCAYRKLIEVGCFLFDFPNTAVNLWYGILSTCRSLAYNKKLLSEKTCLFQFFSNYYITRYFVCFLCYRLYFIIPRCPISVIASRVV